MLSGMPFHASTAWFPGTGATSTTAMASTPAMRPSITVSALKTFATFSFEAPMARRTPISFLRSSTEM